MSQKFCNILIVRDAQLGSSGCFCSRSREGDKQRWKCEMPSSPDTLRVLLTRFAKVMKVINHTEMLDT